MKAATQTAIAGLKAINDGVTRIRAARSAMLARRRAAGLSFIYQPKPRWARNYYRFKISTGALRGRTSAW